MWHLSFRGPVARLSRSLRETLTHHVVTAFTLTILVSVVLASCGSAATGQAKSVAPTATSASASVPTTIPTQVPTPMPTPTPTAASQPIAAQATVALQPIVSQPPPAPASAPAILDLRPLSMSIVGHLDCNKNGAFICFARVLSRTSNQSNLPWLAFTNVPGQITFSPSSGVLAPGQSVLVTITVPFNACTPGLFFFRGPINTHTITWAC